MRMHPHATQRSRIPHLDGGGCGRKQFAEQHHALARAIQVHVAEVELQLPLLLRQVLGGARALPLLQQQLLLLLPLL
jgi:hypothetical protein